MGGSGSYEGSGGSSGGSGKKKLNCNISEDVELFNITPDRRSKLTVGRVLEIEVSSDVGVYPLRVSLPGDKTYAGLAAPEQLDDFIKCIVDKDTTYEAEVIEVSGNTVRVRIKRTKSR